MRRAVIMIRMALFALTIPIRLRLSPPRLARGIEPGRTSARRDDAEEIVRDVDAVLAATGRLVERNCLSRSLTAYRFLREAGHDVEVRFGIGEVKGQIVGHSWLVKDGRPFMERRDPRGVYDEMTSLSELASFL